MPLVQSTRCEHLPQEGVSWPSRLLEVIGLLCQVALNRVLDSVTANQTATPQSLRTPSMRESSAVTIHIG